MSKPMTDHERKLISHWGEMAGKWGINRTVAQIHALLFIRNSALTAEEICEVLNIARSNASNSLKELERLGLLKRSHFCNDRREHFQTHDDVWELFRIILRDRITKEIEPTQTLLEELLADAPFKNESAIFQQRMREASDLLSSITALGNQFLALPTPITKQLLKSGAGLSRFTLSKSPQNNHPAEEKRE